MIVRIDGAQEWIAALEAFSPYPQADIPSLLRSFVQDAQRYPSPPAGSTYRRTYTLRDGWGVADVTQRATMFGASIVNGVSYAPYVVGSDDQAWMHQGRWRTEDDMADAWEQVLEMHLDRTYDL